MGKDAVEAARKGGNKKTEAKTNVPAVVETSNVEIIPPAKPAIPEDVMQAALELVADHAGISVEDLKTKLSENADDDLHHKLVSIAAKLKEGKPEEAAAEAEAQDEVDEEQMANAEADAATENLQGSAKVIHDVLTARIKRVKEEKGESNAKKFETERAKLVAMAAFFDTHPGINLAGLDKIAIYAMQKVRKMVEGTLDPFTAPIVRNVEVLKKAKVPFTAELQNACLSASALKLAKNAEAAKALKYTRDSDPATASTQSSSTRQALIFLGVAKETSGRNAAMEVDTAHPIWREKIAPVIKMLNKSAAKPENGAEA